MKITDIKWGSGNKYKCLMNNCEYAERTGDLEYYRHDTGETVSIIEHLTIEDLLNADFEVAVDWSKVAVDTKVFVKDNYETCEHKRHFAKYEGGKFYIFPIGTTSFTSEKDCFLPSYESCRLAEDKE